MCFEIFFAECKKNNTRQRSSLPSVKKNTRQRASLPSVKKNTRQRASLPSVKKNTRQRRLCRVPEKQHSANHLALGKEPVSGSVRWRFYHSYISHTGTLDPLPSTLYPLSPFPFCSPFFLRSPSMALYCPLTGRELVTLAVRSSGGMWVDHMWRSKQWCLRMGYIWRSGCSVGGREVGVCGARSG